ncbi:GntR family transcriptional regulator [Pedobacter insulae]|uniref:DNA-binding transcriptional regulator YhcF, GntR family n=1 Tax=Pedobacter insulae TaxID=414048 RepID=A0A1I2XXB6_9SPHI|nr:GntR family transcriptional regulator [Pedobacter insulae]SFH16721.1 DNA-binding transcriptional regulator YhcF, GntR family [Pedobacter insulae]
MDFNVNLPIYLQIAEYVCDRILLQQWLPDEKIPSIRELAIELEVTHNTVLRTFEHLQSKNIVYTKRGLGYFIEPNALNLLNASRKEHFLKEELPSLFYKMNIIGFEIDELVNEFEKFKNKNNS